MSNAQNRSQVMIEALEGRQFLSASILGPSAVEGHYKGDAIYTGGSKELKLTITSDSESLTVTGLVTKTVTLSSKGFKKLREGSFYLSGEVEGVKFIFEGSVADKGLRISGTFVDTGKLDLSGTFILKKY